VSRSAALAMSLVGVVACSGKAPKTEEAPAGQQPTPATQPQPPGSAPATVPPSSAQAQAPQASRDTARGLISLVGSEPERALAMTHASGSPVLALSVQGADTVLRRLAGLEVMVTGARTSEVSRSVSPAGSQVFRVSGFVVRAAHGEAAVDGILIAAGSGYRLALADGRRLPVARLPDALRSSVGARVYLAGPLDRPPAAYGVIATRP
jgi:hypothetical protein